MRRIVIVVIVSLLLAGCGKFYWNKPGASLTEFSQDNQACAREHALYLSGNKDYGIVSRDLYRACMTGRGWKRAQQQQPVPDGWFRGIESDDIVRLGATPAQPPAQPPAASPGQAPR